MPNGLSDFGLVLEVAEITKGRVITTQEFGNIMEIFTAMFVGIAITAFVGMVMSLVIKGFTKGTGVEIEEVAGIPIPIYEK